MYVAVIQSLRQNYCIGGARASQDVNTPIKTGIELYVDQNETRSQSLRQNYVTGHHYNN